MTPLPDGWVETTVGGAGKFITGFPFASSGFSDSGVRLIRGSNVKRGSIDWSQDIARYWPAPEPSLKAFELREGDIVIAMDGALVGRSYARIGPADLPAYLVQRVARLRGTSIHQGLLYAWIGSDQFVKHVDSLKTHTAIPHISPRDIREFPMIAPTEPEEQRRIALALADGDNLIAALARLVGKREAIKQGMMQELLTGNTRLPGFTGAWTERRLGSLGTTYGGLSGKTKDDFGVGTGRYIPFMAVMSDVRVTAGSLVRVRVAKRERQNVVRTNDLLFNTSSETPDELAMCAVAGDLPANTFLNSFCFGFRLASADEASPLFLAYMFRSGVGRQLMNSLAQGAIRYNLSKSQFRELCVTLPPADEQRAIASALADADRGIRRLRARLTKAKAIKEGMRQELLTGRTRLPVLEVAA